MGPEETAATSGEAAADQAADRRGSGRSGRRGVAAQEVLCVAEEEGEVELLCCATGGGSRGAAWSPREWVVLLCVCVQGTTTGELLRWLAVVGGQDSLELLLFAEEGKRLLLLLELLLGI